MRVKLILPAVTEAKSPFFRPVKYALFPPLGLATLAAYLQDRDEVTIVDEHVETVELDDEPELVGIEVYISSARRPTTTAGAALTSRSVGCTSPPVQTRPPNMLIPSSWALGKTPGPGS